LEEAFVVRSKKEQASLRKAGLPIGVFSETDKEQVQLEGEILGRVGKRRQERRLGTACSSSVQDGSGSSGSLLRVQWQKLFGCGVLS
jgi:hypothetical protein